MIRTNRLIMFWVVIALSIIISSFINGLEDAQLRKSTDYITCEKREGIYVEKVDLCLNPKIPIFLGPIGAL